MTTPWLISLHGGHSGEFCDHAVGTLDAVVESAFQKGFSVFGMSEHAPRDGAQYLYDEEIAMGWDVPRLFAMFEAYAEKSQALQDAYRDRLTLIRGFETEVVPEDRWLSLMDGFRKDYGFEFVVGSVHHLFGRSLDGPRRLFEASIHDAGGLEPLAMAYYDAMHDMIEALEPEVVGHFDLIRRNGVHYGPLDTPAIRERAIRALGAAQRTGAILDLNAAAYSKGLETPYPQPWLLAEASAMDVPFCFGDDSHGPDEVGRDLDRARDYLLEHGIDTITTLDRDDAGGLIHRVVPLKAQEANDDG